MKKIIVNSRSHNYPIFIQNGLRNEYASYISQYTKSQKVFILTDTNVEKLYLDPLVRALEEENFDVITEVIEAGEKSKSLQQILPIYEVLINNNITRLDTIIALGGGVVGDLAGFVASTYLRGIPFIQVPTTLISQVDSSVGGKVGVDLPYGKNLVGSFYHPRAVFIDPEVLSTLPV